jgi:hypothetical protein
VLVPNFGLLILLFELLLVDFLKNVLKPAVVFFQDGVFGAEVQRVLSVERVPEAAVRELLDRLKIEANKSTSSVLYMPRATPPPS